MVDFLHCGGTFVGGGADFSALGTIFWPFGGGTFAGGGGFAGGVTFAAGVR